MSTDPPPDNSIELLDHGFVRLDEAMADDLSVVNGARVSFARRKTEMEASDEALIRFLMRDRHGSPFEHNAFRFHVRCPIFVAREWFRHRIGCLTGDTVVSFLAENGRGEHVGRTIDELWRNRAGGAGTAGRQREELALATGSRRVRTPPRRRPGVGPGRVPTGIRGADWHTTRRRAAPAQLPLRVYDEARGTFTAGRLDGVIDKGIQPVYRLALADGKTLTLTENHRLLTCEGWRRMREAVGLLGTGGGARIGSRCWLIAERGEPGANPGRAGVWPVEVTALSYLGLRQTYDLSVTGPWHNFLANGVVVHNSFNEFSLRYAKATDAFYVPDAENVRTQVGKPGAYSFEPVDAELAEYARERLRGIYDQAYAAYEELVEAGVARELARSLLPVGAYTQFYWTVNARALMNFVSLRNSEFAQLEIRRYAEAVETFFAERMPVTHASFIANGRVAP